MSEELKSCPFCGSSGDCDKAFPHPGKTPTNWPNPERPGDACRPPEGTKSETYHWLDRGYLVPFAWREGDGGAWWSNDGEDSLFSPAQMSDWGWKYVSPCLTPAQIAEMLAWERVRCAAALDRLKNKESEMYGVGPRPARAEIAIRTFTLGAEEIRNLGDAP